LDFRINLLNHLRTLYAQ